MSVTFLTNEDKNKLDQDISKLSQDLTELEADVSNLSQNKADKTDLTSPFNFKGSTAYSALPTSGNTINDTYYCTDLKRRYTWNGEAWYPSSLDESEYTDELSQLSREIEETNKAVYITDTLLSFDNTKSFQYSDENLIVLLSTNFKKGEIISYLKIKNNAGGKIYLINDNDTVVRTIDYSVTSLGVVEETNVKLNYKCDENIRIAIGGNSEYRGSFMYNLSVDESFGTPVDFVKVFISDSVATFSNQNMKIVYAIEVVKKSTNKNPFDNTNVLLVDRNRRDAYNTINEAINSAKDSKENPVTILVMPGVYEEVVNIYGRRNLSIIGINKKDCILQYGSGKYLETPLRADGNFMVKNMTIKGTMEKAGNFLPTDETNGFGCYALHIDDQHPNDNDNYHVIVDNCILYSEAHSAVGIGLHKNTTVELINCELQNNISESVLESSPKRSQYGALYAHSDVSSDGNNGVSTNQKLIVKNCRITTNTDKAIRLELDWNVQQTGNSVFYGFYHNAVSKSDNTVSEEMVDIVEWGNSEISHQMVDSCGNNIQKLNCNS